MDDIRKALEAAWTRVKDVVLADRDELRRRVVRREMPNLSRPPREWCLAIRAGDTRLRMPLAELSPRGATARGREAAHQVRIDRDALVILCAPVRVDGLTLQEASERLGVRRMGLLTGRIKGTFGRKHVTGLGGRWGKPRPVLYAKDKLNPCIRGLAPADEAWSYTGTLCLSSIPPGFEQTLDRVPLMAQPRARGYRDTDGLHPEHPDVDTGVQVGSPAKCKRLPPPEPDYAAWYKWKDGVFVGYDWRNPLAKAGYERAERRRAKARVTQRAWRRRNAGASRAGGSLLFNGWRWICPRCGRRAQVLFWPIHRRNIAVVYPEDRAALKRAGAAAEVPWPTAAWGFACARCHRVRNLSRASHGFWNDLVGCLSCGLLYGREVERPAWLTRHRRRAYSPRPNAPPPWRRLRVQELLLQGWSYKRIAADMNVHWHTVMVHATRIYRQYGVHGRYELARRLGITLVRPVTKAEQMLRRLRAGQTYAQITAEMGVSRNMVNAYVSKFRRRGVWPSGDGSVRHGDVIGTAAKQFGGAKVGVADGR